MAERSKIEWTDATVNFWWGCTKVGPPCDHCYAETLDKRHHGGAHWGTGAPRLKIKGAADLIQRLNRGHAKFFAEHGRRRGVFMHSMSDLFDNEVPAEWRGEAYRCAQACESLDIRFLTKRVGNVAKMVPGWWRDGEWPQHITLMITIGDQAEADRDIPKLLALKREFGIRLVGISYEPALGPVDFWQDGDGSLAGGEPYNRNDPMQERYGAPRLDWIIMGGESGANARPMHPDWARSVRDQCAAAGVPFFFKQWGEWLPDHQHYDATLYANASHGHKFNDQTITVRVGKARAGRLLDGVEHNGIPGIIQEKTA